MKLRYEPGHNQGRPTKAQQKLIKQRDQEIMRRWHDGESAAQIARSIGRHPNRVAAIVRRELEKT